VSLDHKLMTSSAASGNHLRDMCLTPAIVAE